MQLRDEINYPGAEVTAVYAMLGQAAFHERKCQRTGALEFTVTVAEPSAGALEVTTSRVLPTDQVPDFVRSFVGGRLQVIERTFWNAADSDGSHRGTVTVEIAGTPVTFKGQMRLSATAEGARQDVDGELKANVPLVGNKIVKAVEPAVRAAIRVEGETGRAWLAGDSS